MSAASSPILRNLPEDTTLVQAADAGDSGAVEVLIATGASVNDATRHGMTALMSAAANGHLALVSLLLRCGADINAKRCDGLNALALAAFFGHVPVVRELLGRGADIQAKSRFGTSPEMWATARGFPEIAQILRDAKMSDLGEALEKRENESAASLADAASIPELEASEDSLQEIRSSENVEVPPIAVQNQAVPRDDDEWHLDSLDSFELTLEMTPAYVWNAADEAEGRGTIADISSGTTAALPLAGPNTKVTDTSIPARTERSKPNPLPVENQPSPIYSAAAVMPAASKKQAAYPKLVPFLTHVTSDWRRLTVVTLVVMLASGIGTLAFLQLLKAGARWPAARPANNIAQPSAVALKDSAASLENFSSGRTVPEAVSTVVNKDSPTKASVDSARQKGDGKLDVAGIERARKPVTAQEVLRKPTERTTSPNYRQSSTSKREPEASSDRNRNADVSAKRSASKSAPVTITSERAAKVQPPSSPAPLSIEVQRPGSASVKSDSPAAVSPAAGAKNAKSKVIQWP